MTTTTESKAATLYRMVMPKHICPWGLKSKDLLEREGYRIDDRWRETREQTDAFQAEHDIETTPQTFIAGERIGGYDDLRRFFGKTVADPDATSYRPVIAVFGVTALAASQAAYGTPFTVRAVAWFIAFSMCAIAVLHR